MADKVIAVFVNKKNKESLVTQKWPREYYFSKGSIKIADKVVKLNSTSDYGLDAYMVDTDVASEAIKILKMTPGLDIDFTHFDLDRLKVKIKQ